MAVGRLQGTGKVVAEVESRTLSVQYDPAEVTIEAMQTALAQIGYESTLEA